MSWMKSYQGYLSGGVAVSEANALEKKNQLAKVNPIIEEQLEKFSTISKHKIGNIIKFPLTGYIIAICIISR